MTPSLGLLNLLEWLTELREMLTITSLLKIIIKDTNSRMKRYIRQGLGGSWAQDLLSLWSWGMSPSQHGWVHNPKRLPKPPIIGIFMEASSCRHDQLLTPSPTPLPSLEKGGVRRPIPSFSSWCGLSGDQPPSRNPHGVTSLEQKMLLVLLSLRNLQELRSPVSGTGSKKD